MATVVLLSIPRKDRYARTSRVAPGRFVFRAGEARIYRRISVMCRSYLSIGVSKYGLSATRPHTSCETQVVPGLRLSDGVCRQRRRIDVRKAARLLR